MDQNNGQTVSMPLNYEHLLGLPPLQQLIFTFYCLSGFLVFFRRPLTIDNSRWLKKENNYTKRLLYYLLCNPAYSLICISLKTSPVFPPVCVCVCVIDRYYCSFHIQEYTIKNVSEMKTVVEAALTSKYENGSITIQATNLTIKHISKIHF